MNHNFIHCTPHAHPSPLLPSLFDEENKTENSQNNCIFVTQQLSNYFK